MPRSPKKPCSHPNCPNLTEGRFCEEHEVLERRRYNKYSRSPDTNRKYGRAWKRIRDRYIAQHPLCERCECDGKLTVAAEVHHKLPVSQGGQHSKDNLMSLCRSCHNKIHLEIGDRQIRK
ncbi:HNH endonuclease [Eubacterium limosum]|uniref:Putative HNH nuclease YajD n=1 Tax=Eubacterium limosum TaxID=1736 RepID=A0ABT5ULK9_EUBLI|nr:HNH endonuclease signature motif containing protein [Eubacterium limosum]MDE1468890.1 HNH endonuclease signature motif containing protein [Eubacterium limosum]